MNKTLVVVRHAKAKRPVEGQPDIERELSEAGKRSMRATLPDSLGLWRSDAGSIEIWSSPALRAHQTADLLAKALKQRKAGVSGDVLDKDFLWTGDFPALADDLHTSNAETIVIVGHNPLVEDWVRFLTGSKIVFATGGMAAVGIDAEALSECMASAESVGLMAEQPIGRLLWFAQGPVSQLWKTLVSMEKTIAEAANTVKTRHEQFFADPDDIETMHKFRVSIRTLRSLVAFVKPWQESAQNEKAQEDLRDIVGITSRLRELDVLAEQAQAFPERSDELVSFCEDRARQERESVMKALGSKRVRKQLDRVCSDLQSIRWKRRYNEEGLEADAVRARFDEMAESLRADLESLDFAEVEKTHDVRKRAKRVRYNAEQFKDIIGDDAVGIAKNMTAHQDNLGAICDARVNIDIINSFSTEDLPEPIAWDLALLRAENETYLYTTLRESRS